jgi:IS5 family transposase
MDIWYRCFMQKSFVTQAELFVSSSDLEHPALHALDDTEAVLDWSKIEPILSSIYASQTGRPSYPLLSLFRGLFLQVWYRLSDVQLSQCLYRDLLFRKFCHLELGSDVPEASTLGRFRNQLVEHDLWEQLLGEINRQLEAKNIILTEGRINIIDATPIEASQSGSGKGKDGQNAISKQVGMSKKTAVAI